MMSLNQPSVPHSAQAEPSELYSEGPTAGLTARQSPVRARSALRAFTSAIPPAGSDSPAKAAAMGDFSARYAGSEEGPPVQPASRSKEDVRMRYCIENLGGTAARIRFKPSTQGKNRLASALAGSG